MLPIFKTHYSIGKSILTVNDKTSPDGPDSILDICQENKLDKIVIVEDNAHGFLKTLKSLSRINVDLIFGLRIKISENQPEDKDKKFYRLIIFAKNNEGIKKLYKIYSHAFCENAEYITLPELKSYWDSNLTLAIPFYDSFIYYNNFTFDSFTPDFSSFGKLMVFYEDNGLPIDLPLKEKVLQFHQKSDSDIFETKSIYYKNKSDFKAYQTFKIINNRKAGRNFSLSRPELSGCCSDEFCWESYLSNENKAS